MRNPQMYISFEAHDIYTWIMHEISVISFRNQLRKWIYYNGGEMDDLKTNITKLDMNTFLGILALR